MTNVQSPVWARRGDGDEASQCVVAKTLGQPRGERKSDECLARPEPTPGGWSRRHREKEQSVIKQQVQCRNELTGETEGVAELAETPQHMNVCFESNHKYPKLGTDKEHPFPASEALAPLVVWSLGRMFLLWPKAFTCESALAGSSKRKQRSRNLFPSLVGASAKKTGSGVFVFPAHFHTYYVCTEPQEKSAIWLCTDNSIHWITGPRMIKIQTMLGEERRERGRAKPNTISIVNGWLQLYSGQCLTPKWKISHYILKK